MRIDSMGTVAFPPKFMVRITDVVNEAQENIRLMIIIAKATMWQRLGTAVQMSWMSSG